MNRFKEIKEGFELRGDESTSTQQTSPEILALNDEPLQEMDAVASQQTFDFGGATAPLTDIFEKNSDYEELFSSPDQIAFDFYEEDDIDDLNNSPL